MASYISRPPRGLQTWKGIRMGANAPESAPHVSSDKATERDHFTGVVRFARDFRKQLISSLFPPSVGTANPAIVSTENLSRVDLTGSNFESGTKVYMYDEQVARPTVYVDPNHIYFITPPSAEERSIDITVVNQDGKRTQHTAVLQYEDPPIDLSISPTTGTNLGGLFSAVTGLRYKPFSMVIFSSGGVEYSSPNVSWISPNRIEILTPSIPTTGTYSVTVKSPSGLRSSPRATFEYQFPSPTASGLFPTSVSAEGGDYVELSGTYFLSGAVVLVNTTASTTTFLSSGLLSFLSPAGPAGVATVQVRNPDAPYNKLSPTLQLLMTAGLYKITSASPLTATQGTILALTGSNFTSSFEAEAFVRSVKINGVTMASGAAGTGSFSLIDGHTITGTLPDLGRVTFPAIILSGTIGQVVVPNMFKFVPTPVITAWSPTSGSVLGGTIVTLFGRNFLDAGAGGVAKVSGVAVPLSVTNNGTRAYITMPAGASGTLASVVFENDSFVSATAGDYTYIELPSMVAGFDAGPGDGTGYN